MFEYLLDRNPNTQNEYLNIRVFKNGDSTRHLILSCVFGHTDESALHIYDRQQNRMYILGNVVIGDDSDQKQVGMGLQWLLSRMRGLMMQNPHASEACRAANVGRNFIMHPILDVQMIEDIQTRDGNCVMKVAFQELYQSAPLRITFCFYLRELVNPALLDAAVDLTQP